VLAQRGALLKYLQDDVTLTAIAGGGIYDAEQVDRLGLRLRDIVDNAAWDDDGENGNGNGNGNGEEDGAHVAILIRWRTDTPTQIRGHSERRFVEIYYYDESGQADIERARARVKALLDRQLIQASDVGLNMYHYAGGLGEFAAEEMGYATAQMDRFFADYTRPRTVALPENGE
jgi:hypothetical protein